MKRNLLLLLILGLIACTLPAQPIGLPSSRQDLPTSPLIFKRYHVAKLELLGPVMLAWYLPAHKSAQTPPIWPAWMVGTFELGLDPKNALVVGGGFRYGHFEWADFPASYFFRDATLVGAKLIAGYRHYLGRGYGQGFFMQPTAKYVWQSFNEYSSQDQEKGSYRDIIATTRFGLQKRICKGLHIEASIGPGLGLRNDYFGRTNGFRQYWNASMDEIDLSELRIIDSYGPQYISLYLIGDANFALGWSF